MTPDAFRATALQFSEAVEGVQMTIPTFGYGQACKS